ncbi:hypothetical protein NL529_34800, partial [Klebsiella pneumoniae]|nr:hypothetical protein [Klebsiella pneumoniae]
FQKECEDNQLQTVRDLLEFYNNLDVKPFLNALLNQREQLYAFYIDQFKDFFTISQIAKHILAEFGLRQRTIDDNF